MTITADTLTYAVMRGREKMRGLYTDRCEVTREAIDGDDEYVAEEDREMDPSTMQYPPQGRVVVYRGPCRLQVKVDINSNVVEAVAGDREATYLTGQFQVPVEKAELEGYADSDDFDGDPALIDVDHVAEILLAPFDSALPDRKFTVKGPYHKSQQTYRRFRVNEAV